MTAVPTPLTPEQVELSYRQAHFNGEYVAGDRVGLLRLLTEMVDRMPADGLQVLMELVVRFFGERGEDQVLRDYWQDVAARQARGFIDAVNQGPVGRGRVVFVTHQINYKVLREALYLRKHGFNCFLIALANYPPEVLATFDSVMLNRFVIPNNLLLLGVLLQQLRVDIIHVHCDMHWYSHGRVAIERKKGRARVVCEFNDIGSVYAEREAMCRRFPAHEVDFDVAMERYVCNYADGFVHQWNPAIEGELRTLHGGLPPAIEFQPYACSEFSHYSDEKWSSQDGILRFVYAGNVCPVSANTPGELFPGRYLPETAESLCAQGFALDVLQDPSKYEHFWDPENRYATAMQRFPRFQMKKGVTADDLARAICHYDYGMMLLKFDPTISRVTETKLRLSIANKFFAYLEAGLPLVVTAEFRAMAAIVEKYGIGIAVPLAETDRLNELLRGADYQAMAANVKRFNAEFSMEQQIPRLIGLYDVVLGRRVAAE